MSTCRRRHTPFGLLHRLVPFLFVLTTNVGFAFIVGNSEPLSGPSGTEVTVTGTDFQASPGYTITVEGTPATAQNITGTSLTFTVPPGATSGTVEITDGTDTVTFAKPFKVNVLFPAH